MLKAFCKNLIWIAVPVGLAAGCCSPVSAPQGAAFSLMAPDDTLVASSAYQPPQPRTVGAAESPGYSESGNYVEAPSGNFTETPTVTSTSGVNVVPAGANPATWAVAQEIQDRLIADQSLAPLGSSLTAEVGNDGMVTLRGSVATEDEQQRVADSISGLPGVKGINNQLTVGRVSTVGKEIHTEDMERNMQMQFVHPQ